jgi:hypothetical protein
MMKRAHDDHVGVKLLCLGKNRLADIALAR